MSSRGSIYKRAGSKNYWIKYYRGGRPFQESVGSDKVTVAKRLLNFRMGKIAEGKFPGLEVGRTTVDELVDQFLKECEANQCKSIRDMVRHARLIKEHFAGMKAANVTTQQLREYRHQRKSGWMGRVLKTADGEIRKKANDSTVNRELSFFRAAYNFGKIQDPPLVAHIPHFPMGPESPARGDFFTYEEFQKLQRDEKTPNHLKVMMAIAHFSGMRAGEIKTLKWEQIDWNRGVIRLNIGTTKNDEAREVPLISELRSTLEWWQLETQNFHPQCPWIIHNNGKKYNSHKRAWNSGCERAGLQGRHVHDFRRVGVRNLIRAGISQAVAMKISGHKTDSVFRRYDIVSHPDIIMAGEKLSKFVEQEKAEYLAKLEKAKAKEQEKG